MKPNAPNEITYPAIPKRTITTRTPSDPFGWAGFNNPTVTGDRVYWPQRPAVPPTIATDGKS